MIDPNFGLTNASSWQLQYVLKHQMRGHSGYCYAWLDTALCPMGLLNGSATCNLLHEYPPDWNSEKIDDHLEKQAIVRELFSDDDIISCNDNICNVNTNTQNNLDQNSGHHFVHNCHSYICRHKLMSVICTCSFTENKKMNVITDGESD